MARGDGKLNARRVATISEPGRHTDGRGLHLYVRPNGSKSWVLRQTLAGRRRDFVLGNAADVSLADARRKAAEWRSLISEGIDPVAIRAQRKAEVPEILTFEDAAREFHKVHAPSWATGHAARWISSLENRVFPSIGTRPLAEISPPEIVECLTPIWISHNDTAKRLRQRIASVFDWAIETGAFSGLNPIAGKQRALPRVKRETEHMPAMPWPDVPAFYVALEEREAVSARALQFLILTATRSSETRGARWGEIEGDVWTIPAERMKTRAAHRVPLSEPALALLEQVRGLDPGLIFPSPQRRRGPDYTPSGKPMSAQVFARLYDRANIEGATTHGFRTSFRNWCAEAAGADREIAELCLSHRIGSAVEQAYNRTDLLERRRVLMDQWGRHVTGKATAEKVIPLHRG